MKRTFFQKKVREIYVSLEKASPPPSFTLDGNRTSDCGASSFAVAPGGGASGRPGGLFAIPAPSCNGADGFLINYKDGAMVGVKF